MRGSGPGRKKEVYGTQDSNTYLFSCLLAVGEPLPVPKIEKPSQEVVDKFHTLYMEALHKLFEQHKTLLGCSKTQKLLFL